MIYLLQIVQFVLTVVWWIIIVQAILSWLIAFNVINTSNNAVRQIWAALEKMTDPIYRPIRNVLPNTGGLDLAPLVLFIIIIILQRALANNAGFFYGM